MDKISNVTAIPVSVPISRSYETSLSKSSSREAENLERVIVRIETTSDIIGYGEVAPMAAWPHGLTQGACVDIINNRLSELLREEKIHRIPRIIEKLEKNLSGEPFVLYGIDAALHDILGQYHELPVYDLLGGAKNPERQFELHYAIGVKSSEKMAADAMQATEQGFSAIKVKVGSDDFQSELEGIQAISETVTDARIRIDANQGWKPEEAIWKIRELNEVADGLALVEQPVEYNDLQGLRRVREAVRPPILADESAFSPRDVVMIADNNAADIINIKLAKTGGLVRAKEVATVADAHGYTCFMGSMLELGIGAAANAHFTVSTPNVTYPTGIMNMYSDETLVKNRSEWAINGPFFTVPDRPGLGIKPDTEAIEEYRVD